MSRAYFRFPTIFRDTVVFTSEDDLWEVGRAGGIARRLTAGRGSFRHPKYSPDGNWLAFTSAEEGHDEVYVMPSAGGDLRRLTYLGSSSIPCGWLDPATVLFRSSHYEPHYAPTICRASITGGLPQSLRLGPASNLAISEGGQAVLERNDYRADPAHWKRYRGGTAGKLWIAPSTDGEFKPLIHLNGNLARPLWVGTRVYFVSDHEGVGNLFSCSAEGEDLRQETGHKDFYARNPATDGRTIVYHSGGELYVFDVEERQSRKLAIEYNSQRTQRQRRFVSAAKYLESAALDPQGERCVFDVRGQIHQMRHFDGPVVAHFEHGCRYRLARFLPDGRRVIAVVDKDNGEEGLEIWDSQDYTVKPVAQPSSTEDSARENFGRLTRLEVSPKDDQIAFANHRNELWLLDLTTGYSRKLANDRHRVMGAFAWSPDGRWLAFPLSESRSQQRICVANVKTYEIHPVTEPLFEDFGPSFDPEGRYLYFLSDRVLNPVYDSIQFELSFTRTALPCLVTLTKEAPSPFLEVAKDEKESPDHDKDKEKEVQIDIDFGGIAERILAFPVPEARYVQLAALKNKVMWLFFPVQGAVMDDPTLEASEPKGTVEAYDFKSLNTETLGTGISGFTISADHKQMLLCADSKLRVAKAGEKFDDGGDRESVGRKSGRLDLERLKVLIEPATEWKQMLREAWRLQRDHFWRADMSKVDWVGVLERYAPLVERVNCRSEFADLVWEMQGELGTSHAYDYGGDYREEPRYPVGFLGADFSYDEAAAGYRIERLLRGDPWKTEEACPLRAPGAMFGTGDIITAVNGQRLSAEMTPHQTLLHQAGTEVHLTVRMADGSTRQARVRALRTERDARYRDWVETNRDHVKSRTSGRVGYIHIPDMMARGFAEFHRHFLRDYDADALIVDVRYNVGGHVSQLLLEKLCRKRLGADYTRWFGTLPFPSASPAGPIVALTNEYAGSDGDIFSHAFKLKKAGPLIGRRTWGGVVGIWPRHRLIDGGVTTQPEFSHWFVDVGWSVENYGTDPDIDVDIAPHDYRQGKDPQLDRAIAEALSLMETQPPFRPPAQ